MSSVITFSNRVILLIKLLFLPQIPQLINLIYVSHKVAHASINVI